MYAWAFRQKGDSVAESSLANDRRFMSRAFTGVCTEFQRVQLIRQTKNLELDKHDVCMPSIFPHNRRPKINRRPDPRKQQERKRHMTRSQVNKKLWRTKNT